jgi:hypothetical protein
MTELVDGPIGNIVFKSQSAKRALRASASWKFSMRLDEKSLICTRSWSSPAAICLRTGKRCLMRLQGCFPKDGRITEKSDFYVRTAEGRLQLSLAR